MKLLRQTVSAKVAQLVNNQTLTRELVLVLINLLHGMNQHQLINQPLLIYHHQQLIQDQSVMIFKSSHQMDIAAFNAHHIKELKTVIPDVLLMHAILQ